ncbi:hypothetical protein GCM10010460_21180 [Microbacterium terrae]|nr:hypothetical protein GCM10017594_32690 [Microbacterium terrae]
MARALVTGSGWAPEWICLVSKRQFSVAVIEGSCGFVGPGSAPDALDITDVRGRATTAGTRDVTSPAARRRSVEA